MTPAFACPAGELQLGKAPRFLNGGLSRRSATAKADRLEIVAGGAVVDVELVTDDREPHGVSAEQQLAVFDRMEARIVGNGGRPSAVPAGAVAIFASVDPDCGSVHPDAVTSTAAARTRAAAPRLHRRRSFPCAWRRGPAPLSATA